MSFLNTVILFGLAAASLPLIIHLFTRSKSKTIRFSSLKFLKELQQQNIRRIKLRQILLMILRTLIIILLILAFSRPVLKDKQTSGGDSAKTSAAIILDNSFSMERIEKEGILFERALNSAKQITSAFKPGDELYFIKATDSTRQDNFRTYHDPKILEDLMEDLKISYKTADLDVVINKARNLLTKSHNINKEIYLVTDFQKNSFQLPDTTRNVYSQNILGIPVLSSLIRNLSIESLAPVSTIFEPGKVIELQATVRNTGSEDEKSRLLQLYVQGERVAQTSVDIEKNAIVTKSLKFVLNKTGYISGYLLLEEDDFLIDNRRYFSFYIPETNKIGGVYADETEISYIRLALETKSRWFNFDEIKRAELEYITNEKFDILVLANLRKINRNEVNVLQDFTQNGGGIIFILGDHVDIRAYNDLLSNGFKLPTLMGVMGSTDNTQNVFSLGTVDFSHPIFSGVFQKSQSDFAKPHFNFAIKLKPSMNMIPIIDYSNGSPFLCEYGLGQGKVLIFTTSFKPEYTDIIRKTIFAPLITRSAGYLGYYHQENFVDHSIGEEIQLKLPIWAVNDEIQIFRPDGRKDRIQPEIRETGTWIYYNDIDLPGLYEIKANDKLIKLWVANVDHRESNFDPVDKEQLAEIYGMRYIENVGNFDELIREIRYGKELWKYILLVAIVLLFLEMIIYREKGEVLANKNLGS